MIKLFLFLTILLFVFIFLSQTPKTSNEEIKILEINNINATNCSICFFDCELDSLQFILNDMSLNINREINEYVWIGNENIDPKYGNIILHVQIISNNCLLLSYIIKNDFDIDLNFKFRVKSFQNMTFDTQSDIHITKTPNTLLLNIIHN